MIEFLNELDPILTLFGIVGIFTLVFGGVPLGIWINLVGGVKTRLLGGIPVTLVSLLVVSAGTVLFVEHNPIHPSKIWVLGWIYGLFIIPHIINTVMSWTTNLWRSNSTVNHLFLLTLLLGLIFPLLGLMDFMDQLTFWTTP